MGSHRFTAPPAASTPAAAAAAPAGSRHRGGASRHRARSITLVTLLLVVGLGSGGIAWSAYQGRAPRSCDVDPVNLRVVTSPSLVEAVRRSAAAFGVQAAQRIDESCVRVTARSLSPEKVGEALGAAANSGNDPGFDVWIPDSTTWARVLSRRPEVDRLLPDAYPVLASTPTVIAMPQPMADAAGWTKNEPTLAELVGAANDPSGWGRYGHPAWGPIKMSWTDVSQTSAGLDVLMTLYGALSAAISDPDEMRARLAVVQNTLGALDADPARSLGPLRDTGLSQDVALGRASAVPSTEREVTDFNRTKPAVPLAAVNLRGDDTRSRVGYLAVYGTTVDRDRAVDAAQMFGDYLLTAVGSRPLLDDGWLVQPPSSMAHAGSRGRLAPLPQLEASRPSTKAVTHALQSWSAVDRKGSVLIAVDVSGSMNQKVAKLGVTRLELARRALDASVVSFSDRSSLGLWEFSRRLDGVKDYDVVVPLGPSGSKVGKGTRRDAVRAGARSLKARGDTGLYDTTLAAVREVRRQSAGAGGVVVVLSDGRNEDPGSIGLKDLNKALKAENSGKKPVRVYTIAYGADADAEALREIARASSGSSFTAESPADLQQVLLVSLTG